VTVGSDDLDRSRAFYEPVMAALGIVQPFQMPGAIELGELKGAKLFVLRPFDAGAAAAGNGVHAALLVPTRTAVDAFHAAALTNGGSDEGAPGLRSHYHENYYAACVLDPDGNKLQAVCHRKPA
jgi:catechol 2,3-dioxygenase-like lactoylglutathione lyase family enzyme